MLQIFSLPLLAILALSVVSFWKAFSGLAGLQKVALSFFWAASVLCLLAALLTSFAKGITLVLIFGSMVGLVELLFLTSAMLLLVAFHKKIKTFVGLPKASLILSIITSFAIFALPVWTLLGFILFGGNM